MVDRPAEAEEQHLWFCRAVEQHNWAADGMSRSEIVGLVNRSPLILFSKEKAERSMEFHRKLPPVLKKVRPQLVIDHMSGVLLLEAAEQDECLAVAALTIGYASEHDMGLNGVALTHGQLFLRRKGQTMEYEVAMGDLFPYVYEVDGKRLGRPFRVESDMGRGLTERDFRRGVITALEQLNYLRQPRQILVDDRPVQKRKRKGGAQDQIIARSSDRPALIVLDPEDVQTLRRYESESQGRRHQPPKPHWRRPHSRTLRHPRWGASVGKVIEVGATNVGVVPGEEIQLPRRIYHVVSVGGHTVNEDHKQERTDVD